MEKALENTQKNYKKIKLTTKNIIMKHDFLSDVERDYLKKIEVNNQTINRQKWYVFLRKQRFSHNDEQWKEKKSEIKAMVEEGILCKEMLKDLVVIDAIYEISKIC